MFENYKVFNYEYAGRPLKVEVGKVAGLANGSCMISYGETVILACATASPKPRDGIDFLPLSVDYDEKLYAVGRIPGSFTRREGRPGEKAILTSRVIDRPIRPLFPKDLRNDVALTLTVMSVDPDCSPEITAMIGASIALSISDIPWNGPIGGAFVGMIGDKFVINPTAEERKESVLELTVAASEKKVVMIEAGAKEVSDEDMYNAIMYAHEEIKKLLVFINEIIATVGKPKFDYPSCELDHDMFDKIFDYCEKAVMEALDTDDKTVRDAKMQPIQDDILEKFSEEYPDLPTILPELIYKIQKKIVRRWLLVDKKRVDGRRMDQIRPLASEVGILPRTHGSGLFTRGQTQVLSVVTLGPMSDAQMLDGLDDEKEKRYMHHYNMPGYSTGEAKALRTPGRREIGHGALAERSLVPVLPSKEEFPYAIRTVSETFESNGSTSQASVCGSTLALMDAGVPIKRPVAGVAMGLIKDVENTGKVAVLTDIQGLEDFLGDMDFKVAGTTKGITAIQMDIKIKGITPELMRKALDQAREGRLHILSKIKEAIPAPRDHLSPKAPTMLKMRIPTSKIRDVIGSGGAVIKGMQAQTGCQINIDESGMIDIAAPNAKAGAVCRRMIEELTAEPEPGRIYKGKVKTIQPFGAFVEILPGRDGLVHISELADYRVEKVEDIVHVGDEVTVLCLGVDPKGKVKLSIKALQHKDQPAAEQAQGEAPVAEQPQA